VRAARITGALAVGATGLLLLTAVSLRHPLAPALAVGLLAAARGIWRGKRRAGDLAVGLLSVTAVIGIFQHAPADEIVSELSVAALLLGTRHGLPAAGGAPARRVAVAVVAAVAASYIVAAVTLLASDRATGVAQAMKGAASWLATGGNWLDSAEPLAIALDALMILSIAAAALFIRVFLRPAHCAVGHTAAEHERAAAIVSAYGDDSLDPFALREDKSFHFAAGGVLAYRTLRETAVVSGDPIGPPGSAPAIVASFESYARCRGWNVVLTGASERHLVPLRRLGLLALCIGEEAVVDPQTFSLEGRAIRKVRQSVTRLERRGWTIRVVDADELKPSLWAELDSVERRWRASRRRLSGFAMTLGRLWGAEEDRRGVYVVARDEEGKLRAFLRFARYRRGLSLDATRRFGDEPNGLAEAMVVAALMHAKEHGIAEVSLNFAGFAHVMAARAASGRGQRAMRLALRVFHSRFQLERLVHFSDKFGPTWRPRYLVHRRRASLPLTALRVLQAEAYVRPPKSQQLTARWQPAAVPVALVARHRHLPLRPASSR
jgi:lysyl-tRNA synthetase, class II